MSKAMQTECHMVDSCGGVDILLKDHTSTMSRSGQL